MEYEFCCEQMIELIRDLSVTKYITSNGKIVTIFGQPKEKISLHKVIIYCPSCGEKQS